MTHHTPQSEPTEAGTSNFSVAGMPDVPERTRLAGATRDPEEPSPPLDEDDPLPPEPEGPESDDLDDDDSDLDDDDSDLDEDDEDDDDSDLDDEDDDDDSDDSDEDEEDDDDIEDDEDDGASDEDSEDEPGAEAPSKRGRPRGSRLDDHLDIVGILPDTEVAERLGMTRSAVAQYRQRHDIPPPQRTAEAERTGGAALGSRAAGPVYGWRIRMEIQGREVERVVVAASASAAASIAARYGDIVSIERMVEALG